MTVVEAKSTLTKSSKQAAIISLIGVFIVVVAMGISFYYLSKQIAESQRLTKENAEKTSENKSLDQQIEDKKRQLREAEQAFADYKSVVQKNDPELNKVALEKSIEKNPQAKQVIENIKSIPNTPTAKRNDLKTAQIKEREGFQSLISGNYDVAIKAFQASEDAYNTYHQVYELAKFIREHKNQFSDPAKKKELFQEIVKEFPYGAPPDLWKEVKAIAAQ